MRLGSSRLKNGVHPTRTDSNSPVILFHHYYRAVYHFATKYIMSSVNRDMLNSLRHSTSFHHIVFRSESQLGLPGLAPDCKTKKIILYLSLMMTDRAENLCKQGGSDYQARWCTSKAFPKGYTAIEMKE